MVFEHPDGSCFPTPKDIHLNTPGPKWIGRYPGRRASEGCYWLLVENLFVEATGPILNLLFGQNDKALLDRKGRFRIDAEMLKSHYSGLLENDHEALRFFFLAAERWHARRMDLNLDASGLRIEIEVDVDSPVLKRLAKDPMVRLSALFPTSHFLFELAQGVNILLYSERTQRVELDTVGNCLQANWVFKPGGSLRSSIQAFLRESCSFTVPWSLNGQPRTAEIKQRQDPTDM